MAMLSEPELRLDPARVQRNIARMLARAQGAGVRLRPHFKTHQSHAIGQWFRAAGVDAITVSSLAMAEYFADDGWDDVLLAFPFHRGMTARIEALAQRVRLAITVADPDTLDGVRLQVPVDTWLKIDVGSARTGIDGSDIEAVRALAQRLAGRSDLRLCGLLAHAGHSYRVRGPAAVLAVHEATLAQLRTLQAALLPSVGPLQISVGDTPTCSIADTFPGVDEIRPGNFVFYDLSQWQIGACAADDIAVAMACPVVARHRSRGQLVVHGGAVHFSKDWMQIDGRQVFGLGLDPAASGDGWAGLQPALRLSALSQEHGLVDAPAGMLDSIRPGDTLLFAPVHSCLTADAMGRYRSLDGADIPLMPR